MPGVRKYQGHYGSASATGPGRRSIPDSKKHAEAVLTRLRAAVDAETFSPEGEKQSLGSGQRLSDFIQEWQTHYAESTA